jgi:protein-disulfide isomerase
MTLRLSSTWLVLSTILTLSSPVALQAQISTNKAEIEKTIREYLLEHPEILIEMTQTLQKRQAAMKREQAQSALSMHGKALRADTKTPAAGAELNRKGVVTVVEFFDYRCGYCKKVNPTLQQLMTENPDVRVVYKQYPILGEESTIAARASLAAAKQGAFLKFHNALLESQDLSMTAIESIAAGMSLDIERLKKDMASEDVKAEISRSAELAAALSIEATPSFVIGDEVVPGAIDEAGFQRLVAKAKAALSQQNPAISGN